MKLSVEVPTAVKARLRAVQVGEWMVRPTVLRSGASLRELVDRGGQGATELAVVEDDNILLGWVRPVDATQFPREAWETLQVGDIMRPLDEAQVLSPHHSIDEALRLLESLSTPPESLPVTLGRKLIGELPCRLLQESIDRLVSQTPPPRTEVRLCAEEPVLRADGTRLGRLTRVGICRKSHRVTHLVVKVDGWAAREVALPSDGVRSWGPGQIQTRCTADDVALLDDFISYVEEPAGLPAWDPYIAFFPVMPCVRRSVPDSTACVGRDTRLWNGSRSLGRWLDARVDPDTGELRSLGYVSGLLRKSEHELPADSIADLDDDRIDCRA